MRILKPTLSTLIIAALITLAQNSRADGRTADSTFATDTQPEALFDRESATLVVVTRTLDDLFMIEFADDGEIVINGGDVRVDGGTPTRENTSMLVIVDLETDTYIAFEPSALVKPKGGWDSNAILSQDMIVEL